MPKNLFQDMVKVKRERMSQGKVAPKVLPEE